MSPTWTHVLHHPPLPPHPHCPPPSGGPSTRPPLTPPPPASTHGFFDCVHNIIRYPLLLAQVNPHVHFGAHLHEVRAAGQCGSGQVKSGHLHEVRAAGQRGSGQVKSGHLHEVRAAGQRGSGQDRSGQWVFIYSDLGSRHHLDHLDSLTDIRGPGMSKEGGTSHRACLGNLVRSGSDPGQR